MDRTVMLSWMVLMFGVVMARAGFFIAYRRIAPSPLQAPRWGVFLIVSTFASGALWGAVGAYMADPAMPEQFSLILAVLLGFGAGGVISFSAYLPVFYVFFLPALLPFEAAVLLHGSRIGNILGVTTLIFVSSLSFFARNQNKVFTQSVRLRFENLDLVKELTLQKDSAERANAAKTRFLAAASHDLRQPLHAMGLFVAALSERMRSAVTRKLVSQLSASTDALRGLLNSLLDISRLDAGVIRPHISTCSVQELFERMEIDYSAFAEEKNIKLKFMPSRYWVKCDVTLLERIVRNLISNAVRYTEHGGVLVGCRSRGAQVHIEVWDTGIGIDVQELDKVFHEFYQVGNPERDRSQGLGLGLAIAQRLARLLDLRIEVRSIFNKGSVFSLTLLKSDAPENIHQQAVSVTTTSLKSALVVVIDDELAIREATQLMLEDWGCVVVLADSGDAALAELAKYDKPPTAIIADYRLRDGKTGVEAITALHTMLGLNIPAIIITGDTAPDRIREAEGSSYHLLHKPLAPAKLRALLSHVLARK